MKKKYAFLFLFLLLPLFLFAQETDTEKDKKAEKSVKEEREEKLLYGINSEILDLLKTLKDEKNPDFNSRLTEILKETKNRKVSENIIDLFIATDYYDADETVYRFVEESEYSGKNVVRKSIQYLSESGKEKYNSDFLDLLDSADESYRIESVKALSKSGNKEYTEKLIEQYENDESDRVRTEILLYIGELEDNSAVDFLIDILEDDYSDKTSKQYACNSLGLIGDDRAYPALLEAYGDSDPYIRAYALDALSKFKKEDTEDLFLQALKDDSANIRKQAAVSASKMKNSAFVPFLKYKALNDPVKNVRIESVKALSAIASSEALDFLKEKAADNHSPIDLRKLIIVELINNNFTETRSSIDKILESEWESKTPVLLDIACGTLAEKESGELADYYSRMLDHPSLTVKLSGLKGIKKNKCSSLKGKVEKFTETEGSSSFKRFAKSVLESL